MTTGTTNLDILELSVPSSEADEIHSGAAPAGHVLTADGSGGTSWQAPYARYVAAMWQIDTDAPSFSIVENAIGNIVWARLEQGVYRGVLPGAFPAGRTLFVPTAFVAINSADVPVAFNLLRENDNGVTITCMTLDLNLIDMNLTSQQAVAIEIRVYPA